MGYSSWGHKESDMPERLCAHMHTYTALGLDSKQITFKRKLLALQNGSLIPLSKASSLFSGGNMLNFTVCN